MKINFTLNHLSAVQHSLPEVTSMEIRTFSRNRDLDAVT